VVGRATATLLRYDERVDVIPMNDPHVQELKDRLRQLGLRATSVRLAVLAELHRARRPLTHEELMLPLSDAGADGATVYRVLSDLAEVGLLRRMDLGDKVWRFELDDACRGIAFDHPHFMCEQCRSVACLPRLELRTVDGRVPEALVGASLTVQISGTCGRCASA
jgi:Fur family ferric uptake transcriptional regulator